MSQSEGQQQMDAVVMQASGPPAESLAVRSEPVPEPGPGDVLVEVHAASVNPLDCVNALGGCCQSAPWPRPKVFRRGIGPYIA